MVLFRPPAVQTNKHKSHRPVAFEILNPSNQISSLTWQKAYAGPRYYMYLLRDDDLAGWNSKSVCSARELPPKKAQLALISLGKYKLESFKKGNVGVHFWANQSLNGYS
ncbi:hypothetical protein CIHG_02037 [Coccidioides immitis H538.4]|uniref:Uncharacterized protein n=1 Tax=Coccidioides immitis H538.4 TaxID=396776 RepID=A0A0J8RI14_COCIT|nr:hypothetical protein CIHG_02037 [Coccidioides immitis H538.4]